MIITIVTFTLPEAVSRSQASETFLGTAPKYRGMKGLVRKYYFVADDGRTTGGVYLWKSREDADRVYTQEWKEFVRGKYGTDPVIEYAECPVVVDNVSGETLTDAPPLPR